MQHISNETRLDGARYTDNSRNCPFSETVLVLREQQLHGTDMFAAQSSRLKKATNNFTLIQWADVKVSPVQKSQIHGQ